VDLLEDRKVDKDHYNQIIRAYGVLVHDICELTPDGVVVYFPSRALLRECRTEWESKENIYEKINQIKRIYEEEEWEGENVHAVHDFKRRCQLGRGAVFFIAAESEFAKFQTFYGYYSKCIIFLGVPYHLYPLETDQKIKFLRLKEQHRFEEALKNVCRCLSNCINSATDIKTVVFADIGYNRTDLQKKWFPFIQEGNLNTLQVLDLIGEINKRCTTALRKQREEEKRRKVEEM
jgi:DNA excision repair protein ERCC-2